MRTSTDSLRDFLNPGFGERARAGEKEGLTKRILSERESQGCDMHG